MMARGGGARVPYEVFSASLEQAKKERRVSGGVFSFASTQHALVVVVVCAARIRFELAPRCYLVAKKGRLP